MSPCRSRNSTVWTADSSESSCNCSDSTFAFINTCRYLNSFRNCGVTMGANNSTRRVSFESDENENVTVVKGIRLSENVINRMREPSMASRPKPVPPPPIHPDPAFAPPPAPFATETVAPLPSPPQAEQVEAPTVIDMVLPSTSLPAVAPPADEPAPAPAVEPSVAESGSSAPVTESCQVASPPPPPPAAAPGIDEEALKKRISEELYEGLEKQRVKAEQDLKAWLEAEKSRASAQAQADAKRHVEDEVSRILSAESAVSQESIQQAAMRERIAAEEEKRRAQLYAKQLEAKEADLNKQDAFYREQVARMEERSAQSYKVTTENYHEAADKVNAKFKRYDTYPVCTDLQGQILACYRENAGKTLHCSNIAAMYLQCVNNAKQTKLRTGG
ncbi:coiled-coil-helix-coiled-coil-helix domain containing 3a isoform X2 [Syngnathoides biaculeatus]|uniref:coiled-coil-helix-coiled-coil-helix domain containing 3a isoform X2 n=1 Tax=Syngnathoides biaculeatus TaxID=300417 RepID=UPI002ADDA83C|nr:coiled-coil-helix-coiled-coil-helix domain containing 3a isoform X2 [Syngnathoides biaculeatus]